MASARSLWLILFFAAPLSIVWAQTAENSPSSPVQVSITGPTIVHKGDQLWLEAVLRNQSTTSIAVPSHRSEVFWWYMAEGGWMITDRKGRPLKSTQASVVRFDNMRQMPTFKDDDFVLLEPGETIEYNHANLGDPSDLFLFPGKGSYNVTLAWHFCTPTARKMPNDSIAYTCGITKDLSQPLKDKVLSTPSFDVHSNAWKIVVH